MTAPYSQLFVHCVWTTFTRLPLISGDVETRLYAAISTKCETLGCRVIALGGVADHLHLLVRLPAALAVADLIQQTKGASSHFMNHEISLDSAFKWQSGYGAFTVSKRSIGTVAEYVHNQKVHHSKGQMIDELERIADDAGF